MKIVITGNYGAGNIGDEMILRGMKFLINDACPGAEITVLGTDPETPQKFPSGIRSFVKYLFDTENKTKEVVREADYFVLGGGGLFAGPEKRANIIWGIQALMAYRYKKPVLMLGQSLGPIKGIFEKWLIRHIFKKAKLIVVRDNQSKQNLEKVGLKNKIHIFPDLAFFGGTETKTPQPETRDILVAMRQMPTLSDIFKTEIAKFLDKKIEQNWSPKFFAFQRQKSADPLLHTQIIEKVQNKRKTATIETQSSTCSAIKSAENALAESSVALCMRLHSIITAIKTGTPFIAINYAPKIRAFLEYAGLDEYALELNEITSENLNKKLAEISRNHEQITKKLSEFKQKFEVELQKLTKILREEIGEKR